MMKNILARAWAFRPATYRAYDCHIYASRCRDDETGDGFFIFGKKRG